MKFPVLSSVLHPDYQAHRPEVKEHIIDMALNGSGIRDTARVLKISPTTVISELKKRFCRLGPPFVMEATPVSRLS
jgi:insertion element IS1 protein InsB